MAAITRARSGALSAARSAIRSASRQWHSSGGLEARGAAGSPRTRTGAAPNPAFQFSGPARPNSQLVSRGSTSMPRIACVQSLLPLHSALAAARLVSRLSTSSLAEQVLLDVRHCEHRRSMSSGGSAAASPEGEKETISVTFVTKDGEEQTVQVPVGMSMLEAAHENDVELEGACEGSLACSTCHVIFMDEEFYNKLPEPSDEENDMLDLAFGLTETSRLGCQVIAKPELNGMRLALPAATRNFAVDGHVPKPH